MIWVDVLFEEVEKDKKEELRSKTVEDVGNGMVKARMEVVEGLKENRFFLEEVAGGFKKVGD